ncbi:hypothetical protein EDD16DRAFT_1725070 [Pisolithus croceorrhizus]|nr:hypothetical protein EDD16DRAFT_1725070 [Pisolithus croceorrhizus]
MLLTPQSHVIVARSRSLAPTKSAGGSDPRQLVTNASRDPCLLHLSHAQTVSMQSMVQNFPPARMTAASGPSRLLLRPTSLPLSSDKELGASFSTSIPVASMLSRGSIFNFSANKPGKMGGKRSRWELLWYPHVQVQAEKENLFRRTTFPAGDIGAEGTLPSRVTLSLPRPIATNTNAKCLSRLNEAPSAGFETRDQIEYTYSPVGSWGTLFVLYVIRFQIVVQKKSTLDALCGEDMWHDNRTRTSGPDLRLQGTDQDWVKLSLNATQHQRLALSLSLLIASACPPPISSAKTPEADRLVPPSDAHCHQSKFFMLKDTSPTCAESTSCNELEVRFNPILGLYTSKYAWDGEKGRLETGVEGFGYCRDDEKL